MAHADLKRGNRSNSAEAPGEKRYMAGTRTLRQAVAEIPQAQWTDSSGEAWTAQEILSQWPAEKLDQPVVFGEGRMGRTDIRAADGGSGPGDVLLSFLPQAGFDIPSEPAVQPES